MRNCTAPMFPMAGFKPVSVEVGQVVFELICKELQYNPIGSVHGGIISSILDSVTGCTLYSNLPAGVGYTSQDMKSSFVRNINEETPGSKTSTKIIHRGKTTAWLKSELIDAEWKVYAHTVFTRMILKIP